MQLEPLFEDTGLTLAIMGMVVVFAALLLVFTFITVLPQLLALLNGRRGAPRMEPAAQHDNDMPEELLVVLAAAVAEALEQPHRIVHTRELTAQDLGWSLEGRMQHHASHRLPHHHDRNR